MVPQYCIASRKRYSVCSKRQQGWPMVRLVIMRVLDMRHNPGPVERHAGPDQAGTCRGRRVDSPEFMTRDDPRLLPGYLPGVSRVDDRVVQSREGKITADKRQNNSGHVRHCGQMRNLWDEWCFLVWKKKRSNVPGKHPRRYSHSAGPVPGHVSRNSCISAPSYSSRDRSGSCSPYPQ